MKLTLAEIGIVRRLDKAAKQAGSYAAFGRKHGISEAYLSLVRRRRKAPGPKILKALGITRTTHFVYAGPPATTNRSPANG